MDDQKRAGVRTSAPNRRKAVSKALMAKVGDVVAAGWCCYSDVRTRTVWAETPSGFTFRIG